MDRDIPSVLTTLAGVASLTDLLAEMPLPTPLPQVLSNKSLLFHPRVAEEALKLLGVRDDKLVPQLVHSLVQTSADHIELKDQYVGADVTVEQQELPELLKAILEKNPNVFNGAEVNSPRPTHWNHTGTHSGYSAGHVSPCGTRQTPQGSPASPASARFPPPTPPVVLSSRPSVITEQHKPFSPPAQVPHHQHLSQHQLLPQQQQLQPQHHHQPQQHPLIHQPQQHTHQQHPQQQQDHRPQLQTQQLVPQPVQQHQTQQHNHPQQQHQQPPTAMQQQEQRLTQQQQPQQQQQSPQKLQTKQQQPQQQVVAPVETHNNCSDMNLFFVDCARQNNIVPNDIAFNAPFSTSSSTDSGVDVGYPKCPSTVNVNLDHNDVQDEVHASTNIRGPSPAQASDAPAPVLAPFITETPAMQPALSPSGSSLVNNQPVVRLDRLSVEDQVLMQKSLTKFAEDRPQLASQLGITPENNRLNENNSDSEGDDKSDSKSSRSRKSQENKKFADQDDDYIPDSFTALTGNRKRKPNPKEEKPPEIIPMAKPKLRRVERKFVPVLEKLSIEELMETNTYHRFNRSIESVLENVNENLMTDLVSDDDVVVQPDLLLNRCQLQDLCTEAAKLKVLGAMEMIPTDRMVRLLNILEINIRGAHRVSLIADPEENENIRQMWMETAVDRVMGATDASLTCLYIMTSPNMPKRVYLEDVIDRVILFVKFQIHNTIFPSYDAVYRIDSSKKKDSRKKKSHSQVTEKSIQVLYNKIHEIVSLVSELLNIQIMTDTSVLHASSMGVPPFFAENVSELQLSCLKLVTTIFTRYEKHRRLLLDDILASIARLPSNKRSLRTYRLNSEEQIQMLTALVLQLIQCVVALPENLVNDPKESEKNENTPKTMDKDILICNKYETATKTAGTFLTVFLNKCGSKTEEIDYRPLFENFVQDLLTTVNKPEWPATELLLSLLGTMLVKNFSNKSTDMSLRVASLDYLGVVAARLRRDTVLSRCKVNTIDQMIKDIKNEEMKEGDNDYPKHKKSEDSEEERTKFLQRVLLDYLAVNGHKDEAHRYARHFYIAQWYKDATMEKTHLASGDKNNKNKHGTKENHRNKRNKRGDSDEDVEELSDVEDKLSNKIRSNDQTNSELFRVIDARKKFYISKIRPFQETILSGNRIQVLQTYIDYGSAELISQYLASKRSFSQSFDGYLKQILLVLRENSIAIRTKAMKCLTMIVEADPSVLGIGDMQLGVNHSFLDHSTSVREAAVDLVGKFVLSRPDLIDKYYDMLSSRILDTGVSVRKRVIKILKDICIECPEFPKIPEICVKMIRRVNDEEGIRKLVMEVFQNMWFTPTPERPTLDKAALLRKVMNITDVVASSRDIGLEWFEQLLLSLFKPKEDKDDSTKVQIEPPRALLLACRQIVDCLIENVLRLEESGLGVGEQGGCSQRLVACLTTLNLFAKIRPQLLVKHASTLQPYLSLKCQTKGDITIISSVARTLELVVPLMEHPSETFLAQLEEDSIKLIIQHDRSVISSCLSCLGSIVNNVTRNFKLIRDCFNKYYGNLMKFKDLLETDPMNPLLITHRPLFRRTLFIVGLLLRHFDFTDKEVIGDLPFDIKDQVFLGLLFLLRQEDEDIQTNTLKAIGFICIRHYEFMLEKELKEFYHKMLVHEDASLKMKQEVLQNIEMYLHEEDSRMIKLDQEWAKRSKEENLKEMGDVSSGMASTIIQLYLKEILTSFLHPDILVRHASLKVIQLILQQGLVHPVQIVPYLICMSTDSEKVVSHSADKQLMEIEKKYPGFIHTKAQLGVRLSYQLQCILQAGEIVRGSRIREQGEYPTALNGYLYSLLRGSRQQRRALALNMLKQFDEQVRTSLSYMLYLADNLAYFPYIVQDEPLFIVHHIDIMISVSGTNLLQSFREGLLINESEQQQLENSFQDGQQPAPVLVSALDEDDEDEEALVARVPNNTSILQSCITAAQGCLLLLVLKQHLKDIYGLSDGKISQYSPSEVAKVYEKSTTRRSNAHFNPKATLNRLKQGAPPEVLDMDGRKDLIAQYLDFKQLMLQLDPDDPDEEDNNTSVLNSNKSSLSASTTLSGTAAITPGLHPATATGSVLNDTDQIMINYKESSQKVPKLVISNRRTDSRGTPRSQKAPDKSKKHRHKKKRKKFVSSSGEDSENDYSDPDFMA